MLRLRIEHGKLFGEMTGNNMKLFYMKIISFFYSIYGNDKSKCKFIILLFFLFILLFFFQLLSKQEKRKKKIQFSFFVEMEYRIFQPLDMLISCLLERVVTWRLTAKEKIFLLFHLIHLQKQNKWLETQSVENIKLTSQIIFIKN